MLGTRSEFLQEASDPLRLNQPFHAGRPGKPRPISTLRPIMLAARRLYDEVLFTPRLLLSQAYPVIRW